MAYERPQLTRLLASRGLAAAAAFFRGVAGHGIFDPIAAWFPAAQSPESVCEGGGERAGVAEAGRAGCVWVLGDSGLRAAIDGAAVAVDGGARGGVAGSVQTG